MRSSALLIAVLFALGDRGHAQTVAPDGRTAPSTAPAFSARQDLPATPASPPVASRDTAGPAPVYSRVAAFTIPFAVTQADTQGLEVLLFVSHDFGANWTLYNRQPASQGQFVFRTNRDAEYWFASRTIPVGTVISAGATFQPELRVVVDTAPPRLDVQASTNANGEIQVEWQAVDDALAPETMKVEYQQALGKPYQAVQAASSAPVPGRNAVTGRANWTPEAGSYFVSIRIQVQDKAGNLQEVTRRLIVPISLNTRPTAPAANLPASLASAPPDPFANYGMAPNETPAPSAPSAAPAPSQQDPPAASPAAPAPTAWPSDAPASRDYSDPYSTPEPAPQTASAAPAKKPEVHQVSRPGAVGDAAAETPTSPSAAQAGSTSAAKNEPGVAIPETDTAQTGRTPGGDSADPPMPSRPAGKATGGSPAASPSLPAGERPRMTSSKRFNLDYSVDAVGPAGVEKVELWVTRNGGRDWDLGWVDEDRESPLLVEVEDEGIYGFRVVIVGKNGLASQTPRAGDLADLWVGVDTTRPIAEITSAAYGSDAHAGQLDIRWAAMDDHLGNRPVTLSFGEKPDGPWTALASGLPNTGQYLWRVDSRVPAQFYLRLEVRDEAGNVAVHRLDEPLESAGLTPKGSVRGFAPLGG
ncbi:MAG: hypothetical protein GX575_25635 [Candidatus Anammoximicrobium sp.]|nr:hypothetical protein [Candidatus Anammoximicrobium sp.]